MDLIASEELARLFFVAVPFAWKAKGRRAASCMSNRCKEAVDVHDFEHWTRIARVLRKGDDFEHRTRIARVPGRAFANQVLTELKYGGTDLPRANPRDQRTTGRSGNSFAAPAVRG